LKFLYYSTEPESNLTLFIVIYANIVEKLSISDDNHQKQQQRQQTPIINNKILLHTNLQKTSNLNSYQNFYFALRSKEVKRQYPKLLRLVFDYILNSNDDSNIDFSSS
jgi:hypothetical protein